MDTIDKQTMLTILNMVEKSAASHNLTYSWVVSAALAEFNRRIVTDAEGILLSYGSHTRDCVETLNRIQGAD